MYEYVISGPAYIRVTYESCWSNEKAVAHINEIFTKNQDLHNHKYSFLYNSFTEAPVGELLRDRYPAAYHRYADSGGLQIISRGMSIDDAQKTKIYDNQGKYSTVAMSFDEIPLKIVGNKSNKIMDFTNVVFNREVFQDAALLSAKNLNNQIDHFIKMKSDAKPLLIVQGNCVDTLCEWVEIILNYIPEEKHQFIAGLSIADKAIGFGLREDIERLYAFNDIPAPDYMKKHLHLLGIGSVRRMLPVPGFLLSGLYPSDLHISYDSTSHSSMTSRGKYFGRKGKYMVFGRDNTVMMHRVLKEMQEDFPGYIDDIDPEFFLDIVTLPRKNSWANAEKKGHKEIPYYYHMTFFLQVFASVVNFANHLNIVSTKKKEYIRTCMNMGLKDLRHLPEIKTRADFDYWMVHASKFVTSQRVKDQGAIHNLDNFFV